MSRMEINEIRRRNLRALLDAFIASGGKKKDFAEEIGIEAPQLTHVTAEPPKRNIGDKIARRIEENLSLQRGWLDVSQTELPVTNQNTAGKKFILSQFSEALSTGQMNSTGFTLIKLSNRDFTGEAKLESYSSVITELNIDDEYARAMFGGRECSSLRIHTVHGDGMLGTISPGEVIVVDVTVSEVKSDGIYLAEFDGKIHLKRFQRVKNDLLVISDNSTYEKWMISEEEESRLQIIGFLIGKWDMTYTRMG